MPPPKSITLPVWAGYRKGLQAKPSTGKVKIQLHHGVRVTERVHTAIAAAKTRAKSMQVILLDAIVVAYPTFRQWHERPATTTAAELAQRVALYELVLPDDHHDGIAYVAYMFSCDWDPSGFVVVTHGERVVVSVDEKSQIQALDRTAPMLPVMRQNSPLWLPLAVAGIIVALSICAPS